ncbi:GNAT family N-acetyltransferase [Clostridium fallax]|uniref:Acetyltransferase (GNAT) family protein n=1 Tax=Clostridium fallax TaxID=1533 RepID=A0A1M4XGH0_9CLOT|nr:GNAT family N-acetyltransferase [Clostridium fallax]SHE92456.1 Acetyltransferase (GNAT) family protein [Clostridium fallax]SQB06411.1 GCN5-related N-acetyltransferase [Clostridium fallax]
MSIYVENFNLKFTKDILKGKYNNFVTNTIETPLMDKSKKLTLKNKFKIYFQLKFIIFDNRLIGYIRYENLSDFFININEISIDSNYIEEILKSNLSLNEMFSNKVVYYEGFDNKGLDKLLLKLGLFINNKSLLKRLDLKDFNYSYKDKSPFLDISTFVKGKDETLRCDLQNEIFNDPSRIPLNKEDIILDQKQDYYLKDFSIFLKYKGKPIGYGQIIKFHNSYMIVNLGVLDMYRGKGLGKYLIERLLYLAKEKNITKIFIRVDIENNIALNLYNNLGFKYIDTITFYKNKKTNLV